MATVHHHLESAHQMQNSAMGCVENCKLPCVPSFSGLGHSNQCWLTQAEVMKRAQHVIVNKR